MRISVVLPCYNEERFMQLALESLRKQSVPHELVVVDNESTDNTVEVAKLYTQNVLSASHGKLNALQLGILDATGNVVFTVDADVVYPPNYLKRMSRHFENSNVVLALGLVQNIGGYGFQKMAQTLKYVLGGILVKYGSGCARALRREAFIEAGGFNLQVNQRDFVSVVMEEEIGLHQRIARYGEIVIDPSIVVQHLDRRGLCLNRPIPENMKDFCDQLKTNQRF